LWKGVPAAYTGGRQVRSNSSKKEKFMKIRSLIIASVLALASSTAFASSCPKHMKAIDAALSKNPKISAEQMADVKKYRAEGEKLHKEGKHSESVSTLAKAEKILGI
jgi:hypothetical protein